MTAIVHILKNIPSWVAFALVALVQVGLIAFMVFDRVGILRNGMEVKLQTQPIDPRDLFRGDYARLSYAMSSIPAGALKDQPAKGKSEIFVKLAPDAGGFYQPVSVLAEAVPVAPPEILIRGRVYRGTNCGPDQQRYCETLNVKYGLEKYFVPQGEGLTIESAGNQKRVTVIAAVTASGRPAIKRLLIDDKPVYDEPLF